MKQSFSLKGKVGVVTGGAGRLGPNFCEALLEAGAKVVLADLNETSGSSVVRKLAKRHGRNIIFCQTDVTDKASVDQLVAFTVRKLKRIDVFVNAAMSVGKDFYAAFDQYSWEDWNEVMRVNVGGVFLCCQSVSKVMKKQKSGSIINIGSIYGMVGADWRIYGQSKINSPAVYAASKGAVINLTRYLAVLFASSGIRVNSISPGGVFSSQDPEFVRNYSYRTPMGRMLNREELKGALVYLASGEASYVTGHNLVVDGGWTAW